MKGMGYRLHEQCSAGCERQANGYPERPTCASIAFDKQSNLNCDSTLFYLCKDVT
jgi:hypothetical protein